MVRKGFYNELASKSRVLVVISRRCGEEEYVVGKAGHMAKRRKRNRMWKEIRDGYMFAENLRGVITHSEWD